mmetsp:Transcript_9594/g.15145  ORF Transcript_9594/g.15145 Transcript_9594/m.15145 type:complete len:162 (-) Transcript_9594:427-912(-)
MSQQYSSSGHGQGSDAVVYGGGSSGSRGGYGGGYGDGGGGYGDGSALHQGGRSSMRVAAPPGGASSFSIGGGGGGALHHTGRSSTHVAAPPGGASSMWAHYSSLICGSCVCSFVQFRMCCTKLKVALHPSQTESSPWRPCPPCCMLRRSRKTFARRSKPHY